MIFKELTPEQTKEFQDWAKENDPENMKDWLCYHPVIRQVWIERGIFPGKGE